MAKSVNHCFCDKLEHGAICGVCVDGRLYAAIKRVRYEGEDISCECLAELCEAFAPFDDGEPYEAPPAPVQPPPSAAMQDLDVRYSDYNAKAHAFYDGLKIHCPDCTISWIYGLWRGEHRCSRNTTPGGQALLKVWEAERHAIWESRGGKVVEDGLRAQGEALHDEYCELLKVEAR